MKGNKNYIVNTILMCLMFVVLAAAICFLLVFKARVSYTERFEKTLTADAAEVSTAVDAMLTDNLNDVVVVPEGGLSSFDTTTFSAHGTISDHSVVMYENGVKKELTILSPALADELSRGGIFFLRLSDFRVERSLVNESVALFDGGATSETVTFYVKGRGLSDENTCDVFVQSAAQLNAQISLLAEDRFSSFAILRGDAVRLTQTGSVLQYGDRLSTLLSTELHNGKVFQYSLNNVPYCWSSYLLSANSSVDVSYYFLAYNDLSSALVALDDYVQTMIVIVGVGDVLLLACCVVYGILIKKGRKTPHAYANSIRFYGTDVAHLTVDVNGDITDSSPEYDRYFATRNISEHVIFNAFTEKLKFGDTFMVLLKDYKGRKHLLNMTVEGRGKSKEKLRVFRLVSSDVTDLSDVLARAMNMDVNDADVDSMKEVYNREILAHKKLLAGRIHVTNLTNLQVMFGKDFSDSVFKKVVEKAGARFDFVFPRRVDDSIGVLVVNASDFNARTETLAADLNELNKPVNVEDNLVQVDCEGGFNMVERGIGDVDFDYIDKCIRAAMKRASSDGLREFYVYHDFQKKQFAKYLEPDFDVKQMLEDDAFEMQFQPQYSIKEKRIIGFESLFRFKNPGTEISVFDFIRYAERTGNMILLGNFIFESSMRFAKTLEGKNIAVSLNVSPVQLMQVGFTENILRLYREYQLKPGSICVEITESFLMTTMEETLKKLDLLRQEGILIHLDDFGTLYSSLLYLKKLPISAIKIDMEFVKDICEDEYSRSIIKMVIDISRQLNVVTIAEGVEKESQKKMLAQMGCDILQGYLIGKSMTEQEALKLI